jgi:SH3-like domain-containing protein
MDREPTSQFELSKTLYAAPGLTIQRACACPVTWKWVMLISLMVATHPWQAVAKVTSTPLSHTSEQATTSPRRGIVTSTSNLRDSPSMQSAVVAIAKEGTHVEILLEAKGWYHVRSGEGVEAWIYKSLVLIEREPIEGPSATPVALAQPEIMESVVAVTTKSDGFVEFQSESIPEDQGSNASSAALIDEPHVLPQQWWPGWFIDPLLSHLQDLEDYAIIALVMVLVLSVTLHLRAARQLRRAMQEMGQILDMVEGLYAGSTLARTNDRDTTLNPMPAEALAQRAPRSGIEFSPTENAVLEALSTQREVQEPELGEILEERGLARVLIKAVIGGIVRKTGMTGLPWVEVRYVQGRYSYRLRPEAVPNLSAQ